MKWILSISFQMERILSPSFAPIILSQSSLIFEEIINIAIYKDKKGWKGDGFLFKANESGRLGSDHIEFG